MKKIILLIIFTIILASMIVGYFWLKGNPSSISFVSPLGKQATADKRKPLEKYTFENLRQTQPETSQIILEQVLVEEGEFTSQLFSYTTEGKKITGQINVPKGSPPAGGFPVILMLRGYIDPETYETGDGTRKAAAVFARNGFVTLAPDYLGHGGSDDPDPNTIAARVRRPAEVLTLINSLDSLPFAISHKLFMWGHSNGGQIALSLLEITGKDIPTTLWAPVSKPFPYSILYYTDDSDDKGKELRQVLAEFEADYDVDNYSIHKYYDRIEAPIQIHQGTADDAVPKEWSDELVKTLKDLSLDVTYYTYPGADHNLKPAWNTVVKRDITFFRSQLK